MGEPQAPRHQAGNWLRFSGGALWCWEVPLHSWFLRIFITNECGSLSIALCTCGRDCVILAFSQLVMGSAGLFSGVGQPCRPGVNPTWSCCINFSICYWIQLADVLLRTFAPLLTRDLGPQCPSLRCLRPVLVLEQRWPLISGLASPEALGADTDRDRHLGDPSPPSPATCSASSQAHPVQ